MKVFKFYITAFLYSWIIWILGIVFLKGSVNPTILVSIGGLGPVVALIVALVFLYNKEERHQYIKRLIRLKEVPILVWVLAIFLPFITILLSRIINTLFFNKLGVDSNAFCFSKDFLQAGFINAIFLLIFGPIPEEMAWRGFALDELLKKGNIKAQVIVSILWGAWHIPLFFIEGSYQSKLGVCTLDFWMFFIEIIFISFITGWMYIKGKRSIIVAIAYHYTVNLCGQMFYTSNTVSLINMIITGVIGVGLLVSTGRKA